MGLGNLDVGDLAAGGRMVHFAAAVAAYWEDIVSPVSPSFVDLLDPLGDDLLADHVPMYLGDPEEDALDYGLVCHGDHRGPYCSLCTLYLLARFQTLGSCCIQAVAVVGDGLSAMCRPLGTRVG